MKKIFLIMFCMVLLVGSATAFNVVSFDDKTGDYGKITIEDRKWYDPFGWVFEKNLAEYKLISNTDTCLMNCEAQGTAKLYENGSLFTDINFFNKDEKSIEITNQIYIWGNYTYEYLDKNNKTQNKTYEKWIDYNYEVLLPGEYQWKIKGQKDPYDSIDWITTAFDKDLTDWAWWDSLSGNFQTFTSNGNFNVPLGVTNLSVLVIAGGGGSPTNVYSGGAGGGGAGGLILNNSYPVSSLQVITVVVGAGGGLSSNGTNSSFGTLIAIGGGGVIILEPGADGGSGSGGNNGTAGGDGFAGQGYNGGAGDGSGDWGAGGREGTGAAEV